MRRDATSLDAGMQGIASVRKQVIDRLDQTDVAGEPLNSNGPPWSRYSGFDDGGSRPTATVRAFPRSQEIQGAAPSPAGQYEGPYDRMPALLAITDENRAIVTVNDNWLRELGYERDEVVGQPVVRFLTSGSAEFLRQVSVPQLEACGESDAVEVALIRKDGSSLPVLTSVRVEIDPVTYRRQFLSVSMDMSAYKRQEGRHNDARRLESVGALASGVAHDFNNILGAMLGFSKFLVADIDPASPEHAYAQRIVALCERGDDLVHQVFSYARAGRAERRPEDIVAIAEETIDALPASLSTPVRLSVDSTSDRLVAKVNASEMERLIVNLALNARDALGHQGGEIGIEVAGIAAGHDDFLRLRAIEGQGVQGTTDGMHEIACGSCGLADQLARITVTDSGKGMSPETLARAFEPFFTTKSRASGAGLGLATVRNIVTAAGGACTIRTAIERGTAVSVWLPLIGSDPA